MTVHGARTAEACDKGLLHGQGWRPGLMKTPAGLTVCTKEGKPSVTPGARFRGSEPTTGPLAPESAGAGSPGPWPPCPPQHTHHIGGLRLLLSLLPFPGGGGGCRHDHCRPPPTPSKSGEGSCIFSVWGDNKSPRKNLAKAITSA
uniref:Uncharacterized protein n=1 Tax=Pipistrellus kuhlii TaxID=59472 RepID=A0A7J7SF88_PIPKU|nr:hypothetical protein mPipKuh1_009995 [Pipistrellus kuhlii]